jgi:hypothetical protein
LLHAHLVESAIEAGVKYVNFGASRGSAGVKKFKESFGAKEQSYGIYFVGNPIARVALKRALRPPTPVATSEGAPSADRSPE